MLKTEKKNLDRDEIRDKETNEKSYLILLSHFICMKIEIQNFLYFYKLQKKVPATGLQLLFIQWFIYYLYYWFILLFI